jgi:hypothetical protein
LYKYIFLWDSSESLSKLKVGQEAHPTINYFCKNGMHPFEKWKLEAIGLLNRITPFPL